MQSSLLLHYIQNNYVSYKLPKLLPLFHSCECFYGKKIIESGKLKPQLCKVFEKNLLYFFYGKPAYPVAEKNRKNRTDEYYCPICFVVNPMKVKIEKIFPFDTGAFKKGMYKDFIHRGMELSNYDMGNNLTSVLKYISIMFQNNKSYLVGHCKQTKSDLMEIQALLNMFNAKGAFEIDERADTIEIISAHEVNLISAAECIILPRNMLRLPAIMDFLKNSKIPCKTYTIRWLTAPEKYNEAVFQIAMRYIHER